jgi:HlyD family secretion protein
MNKMLIAIKNIIGKKIFYIPAILILLAAGGIFAAVSGNSEEFATAKAENFDFQEEVSVTGKVVPAQNVELAFENGGKVASLNAAVGQNVRRGQVLATVNSGEAYAAVLQAQARLQSEQARLRVLENGSRPEEIRIAETAVNNAETNEQQARRAVVTAIVDAQIATDDVIKDKLNQFFYPDPSDTEEDIIPFQDGARKRQLDLRKDEIDRVVAEWGSLTSRLQGATNFSQSDLIMAKNNLNTMRTFLNDVAYAAARFSVSPTLNQGMIDKYRNDVSIARANINSAIGTLNSVELNLNNAEGEVKSAEDNLIFKRSGSNPDDIAAQRALVKSAEASVLQARSVLGKASIMAPFAGTITKVDAKVGQISSPNTPVISLISESTFEVESNVPEADIAKIKVGNSGKLTLDAYGSRDIFDVVITEIDPAETMIEGVANYKTTFQFVTADDRIKSGMTANIDIQNELRTGVLMIPQSAVVNQEGSKKVLVLQNENDKKGEAREIKTGGVDDEGRVEITEGLREGEIVVTNPPKEI